VGVPERGDDGLVTMTAAVTFDADGHDRRGPGADRLARLLDDP
jgi:hypothetical protein